MWAVMLGLATWGMADGAPARDLFRADAALERVCVEAAREVVGKYAEQGVRADQVAVTLIRLDGDGQWATGSFRGDVGFYPASVVKLFYLAYGAAERDAGRLHVTPEIDRAFRDMIVDSGNEATMAVVDVLTGTTGGPELPERELKLYGERRNVVNRWLVGLGFAGINCNQKTYGEGPYGRERQFVGEKYENRNVLTPDAAARMMALAIGGRIAGKESTAWMAGYLGRKVPADGPGADAQSRLYTGKTLPAGSRLWSKAGWTSDVRHDAAVVEFPSGARYAIAVFTREHSGQSNLVPDLAAAVWARLPDAR